jgi:VWFA-related protein
MKIVVAVCLLLLQSTQQPVFRANVNFVELDVSVLDKDRRPVLGLTAADFTVLEDGVPQKVETFSAVVLPKPEPPPTAWWTSVPADVERNSDTGDGVLSIVVLAVNDASLIHRSKQIARRLIERMGPSDRMAVAHTGMSGNSQDFTTDRAALLASVDRLGVSAGPGAFCNFPNLLSDLARLVAPLAGRRKAAFLVGAGVPAPDPKDPCMNDILELYREAQRAHLNIYPIDARGLVGFGDVTIESVAQMETSITALRASAAGDRTLAENTGGIAITQTNLFDENIERVYTENRAYYVLGYHSTNTSTDRKLRQLKVTVAREGVTVRSRTGYSAGGARTEAASAAPSLPAELTAASRAAVPATALELDASALPFRTAKGASVAVIAAARPAIDARSTDTKEEVQARASLVDRFGAIKETTERRVGGVVATIQGRRAELRVPLLVPAARPGRYQVRVAANSTATGATGSVFLNVDVPDFNRERLSMSGIALDVRPDSPAINLPALEAVFPFVPSTRRAFRSADQVEAAVRVYANRPEGPASVVCRIKDSAEAPVSSVERVAAATEAASAAGSLIRCPLAIASLAAGHYLLEIEARAGTRTVTRTVKFVME